MPMTTLIDRYAAGPKSLKLAVADMTEDEINAAPIEGRWSTRQVICHLADFEPIYVDRMCRAIAEETPTIMGGDPTAFAASLAYDQRDIDEELEFIEITRRHMTRILRQQEPAKFQRQVKHSESGLITLETLLTNITNHIPHHIEFIEQKRAALANQADA